jgi:glycosyltransferase involved in cell wall biosynthesis
LHRGVSRPVFDSVSLPDLSKNSCGAVGTQRIQQETPALSPAEILSCTYQPAVVSVGTSATILRGLGVDPARLHVIGSRVDCEFFSPVATAEPALIVSAGAINRDYNTLLEACAGLDVHVTIAADTAWRHSLGKLPEEMSGERFEMRSFGNYRNLRDLYARSTLMVVPLVEGQFASGQTVILEGMAMGKAMITTDIAGRSDFIEDGVNGVYVPSHNVEALRAAIAALLADPVRRAAMADAGRTAAVGKYKVEHYVARILSACDRAASER